jgi:hypothetical protein
MTKFEYATRDLSKEDSAKQAIERQAHARGQTIAEWRVYTATDHPGLQSYDDTKDVEHLIVEGYTTAAEAAAADKPPKPPKPKDEPMVNPLAET